MVRELSPVERNVLVAAADLMERLSDVDRALDDAGAPGVHATAVPVLPTHDAALTVAFYRRIGFRSMRGGDAEYVMLERDSIELHFSLHPDVDPFATAGVARLSVPDADALRAEVVAAGIGQRVAAEDLRARWAKTRDLSGVGPISDKPYRVREFALFDPTNNLILVGHPVGLNRRRSSRRAER